MDKRKGVICKIAEPHEMPIDEEGNRADIVMDSNSTINRMNIGRLYELYINASRRDVRKAICKKIGIAPKSIHALTQVEEVFYSNKPLFDECYNYLLGFYSIINTKMFEHLGVKATDENKINHLAYIIKNDIYLYLPPENDKENLDIIDELEKHYKPVYGKVSYIGNSGERTNSVDNVRIGSMYIMLLEKTGDDYSAVSSGKLQIHGILSQLTKNDKYSNPIRLQTIRGLGEAEFRVLAAYLKQHAAAEFADRNNSPATHREIVRNILKADKPTNIDSVINRKEFPYGGSKPINIVNHALFCGGVRFVHKEG